MELAQRIDELWESGELEPEPIEEAIALLDAGEVRVAERARRRLGGQRVGEEGDPPLLPPAQGRADGGRRSPLPRQDPREVGLRRPRRARRAAGSRSLRRVPVRGRRSHAGIRQHRRVGRARARWSTPGRPSARARRSAPTSTSPAASGIGGVLEPPQARPVIVEDGAFIGSRAVDRRRGRRRRGCRDRAQRRPLGVDPRHRRHGLRAGRASRICATALGRASGHAPEGVSRPGRYDLPCALIVGSRSASTDLKTSLNDVLREFEIAT